MAPVDGEVTALPPMKEAEIDIEGPVELEMRALDCPGGIGLARVRSSTGRGRQSVGRAALGSSLQYGGVSSPSSV
jgi:hypothetical protein